MSPAPTTPAESQAAPEPAPEPRDGRAAAIAAAEEIDATPPSATTDLPASAEEPTTADAAAPEKDATLSSLHARLARADRELQQLKTFRKAAVSLADVKQAPLEVLKAAGYEPEQLLDLWLGTPSRPGAAATKPDGTPRSDGELATLRQQVEHLTQTVRQRDQQAAHERAAQAYRGTVDSIRERVTAGDGKWALVARHATTSHVADGGGGALDLAADVAQIVYQQRVAALGPRPSRQEIEDAAPTYDEVLDLVEAHLQERRKAWADDPGTGAKRGNGKRSLPATPASATPTGKPLTDDERRRRAIARIEELDRAQPKK